MLFKGYGAKVGLGNMRVKAENRMVTIHTATFIKNVFAHTLCDVEISTIERKMSHTESECHIELDKMWKRH